MEKRMTTPSLFRLSWRKYSLNMQVRVHPMVISLLTPSVSTSVASQREARWRMLAPRCLMARSLLTALVAVSLLMSSTSILLPSNLCPSCTFMAMLTVLLESIISILSSRISCSVTDVILKISLQLINGKKLHTTELNIITRDMILQELKMLKMFLSLQWHSKISGMLCMQVLHSIFGISLVLRH